MCGSDGACLEPYHVNFALTTAIHSRDAEKLARLGDMNTARTVNLSDPGYRVCVSCESGRS